MATVYCDYNATTFCDKKVLEAMLPWFTEKFYNPSSIYSSSKEVRNAIEQARQEVANALGASASEIIFTSGGTESINAAIRGVVNASSKKNRHIITSSIEHHAVLRTCQALEKEGCRVSFLPVNRYGMVDPSDVKKAISKDTVLITVMAANNEIGTIEPVADIGRIAREAGIPFHTDGVQAAGKIAVSVKEWDVDLFSLSGHKFYGPKGIGALYVRKGVKISPLLQGGEQERRRRPGTENVPGIIGIGKAITFAMDERESEEIRLASLRDRLEELLVERIPEIVVNGDPRSRLAGTLHLCIRYIEGESMLLLLDVQGIYASSGSACTSGSLDPSHVLLSIGIPHELAHGSLRFSFGKGTTDDDIQKIADALPPIVEKLRKMSPLWKG